MSNEKNEPKKRDKAGISHILRLSPITSVAPGVLPTGAGLKTTTFQ
jgi:hypothetical protein